MFWGGKPTGGGLFAGDQPLFGVTVVELGSKAPRFSRHPKMRCLSIPSAGLNVVPSGFGLDAASLRHPALTDLGKAAVGLRCR